MNFNTALNTLIVKYGECKSKMIGIRDGKFVDYRCGNCGEEYCIMKKDT